MTVKRAPTAIEDHGEEPITGEELYHMPDVGPCELVEGRIVPMTPTGGEHSMVELFTLGRHLANFVAENDRGWLLGGEVGIYTHRDPDTIRGADIALLSRERAPDGPPKGFLEVAPDLIVEIISPGNSWQEMRRKIEEYFAIGVDRVWIVEPANRAVLVFRSSTEMKKLDETDVLTGEGVLEGFGLPVAEIFTV